MPPVQVVTPNVINFRYNVPRPVATTDPAAPPLMQAAQLATASGIAHAEEELRRAGFDRDTAAHLARMACLMFLTAFDGAGLPAGVVFDALIDRLDRERWIRKGGRDDLR